jgi:hypothetical protein
MMIRGDTRVRYIAGIMRIVMREWEGGNVAELAGCILVRCCVFFSVC